MGLSTLQGHTVTSATVTRPKWGIWYADAAIDSEETLVGRVTLKVGDLSLSGTILGGGPSKGRSRYSIVGGAGGWGRSIPKESYEDDAGVKVSTILGDAAAAVGESIDATAIGSARVGPRYARPEGAASAVLERYAPSGWYVGEDGVTRLGTRGTSTLPAKAVIGPIDKARRTVSIASEEISAIQPGIVVEGIEAIDVVHDLAPSGLRTTLWGTRGGVETSRFAETVRTLLDQLDPYRKFRGVTEYRVINQVGDYLNLQPVLASLGMPDLPRVSMRPGVSGCRSDVMLGSFVLVGFVNSDPSRPYVSAFAGADGEGFVPLLTEIDAATFVKLADGLRMVAATGDLAGGILPIVGTTRVMG